MSFEQQPRASTDGPISVNAIGDDRISISVTHDGREQSIEMSRYNAARVFAGMALILGIPLSKQVGKAISL